MADFIKVLCSGSKGNSTILVVDSTKIIIDAGVSRRKLLHKLSELNIEIDDTHILITHHHSDHIKGLNQITKKDVVKLYGSKELLNYHDVCVVSDKFSIDDISIEVLPLSHDAAHTQGYIFWFKDYKITYISDSGYLSESILEKITNSDVLLLESNHDVDLLKNGSYRWELKKRVLSDYGHLSNYQFKSYVNQVCSEKTKYLVALHLSGENNCQNIVSEMLDTISVSNCFIATQEEGCETIFLDWK